VGVLSHRGGERPFNVVIALNVRVFGGGDVTSGYLHPPYYSLNTTPILHAVKVLTGLTFTCSQPPPPCPARCHLQNYLLLLTSFAFHPAPGPHQQLHQQIPARNIMTHCSVVLAAHRTKYIMSAAVPAG
jgi:hypothetical protein